MSPTQQHPDYVFDEQEDYEVLVEIDEEGNVYRFGEAPRKDDRKPTILRDPEGEY